MRLAALGEVCDITMGQAPPGDTYNDQGIGLPLIAGASDFGVTSPQPSRFTSVPTQKAARGDIILCIRATIGDLNLADREYCLGRGVAGIRPRPAHADRSFIWWSLKANADVLSSRGRGATFKQVNRADIEALELPLPPLQEQRRIAAILDQADDLRCKRRETLQRLSLLPGAFFLKLFGNPRVNESGYPVQALKQLGRVVTGSTPPSAKAGMFGGPVPFVTPGDLGSGERVKRWLSHEGADESRTVPAGSALVCCIGATIGKMDIVAGTSAFNQQINAVEWGPRVNPIYGINALRFHREKIIAEGTSTTLPILKKSLFEQIKISVPPIDLQDTFAARVTEIDSLEAQHRTHLAKLDALFASLQHRAFRG